MTAPHTYITTTIPYVNARPHLGFALELVQADVLARHRRRKGDQVRFQTGTDDNSLKNVLAAEAAGVSVQEFVDRNAAQFVALAGPLALSADDVIRTSRDPRHRPGVERFWAACADAGDLYRKHYEGLYCVGCEQFYLPAGASSARPTATSTASAPGTWPGPNAAGTTTRASTWAMSWPPSSGPASSSPRSWRPSCPARRPASAGSARPARTDGCPALRPSSRGCPEPG